LIYCGHAGAFDGGKRAKTVETNKFTPLRMAVKGEKLAGECEFFSKVAISDGKQLD